MPPINVSDQALFSRFWYAMDTGIVTDDFQKATGKSITEAVAPEMRGGHLHTVEMNVAPMKMTSLLTSTVDNKYDGILGRAKAFAGRIGDLSAAREVANALGLNFDTLKADLISMVAQQPGHQPLTEARAHNIMSALLLSPECTTRKARNIPLSKDGLVSLMNAAVGCSMLIEEGKATEESIFELMKGDVYDLTNPGDVLKLAVKTVQGAIEKFVDADHIKALANKAKLAASTDAEKKDIDHLANKVIYERRKVFQEINLRFETGSNTKESLQGRLKLVMNMLRSVRYKLDKLSAPDLGLQPKQMSGKMESLRRWLDNAVSVDYSNLTVASFGDMRHAEELFGASISRYSDDNGHMLQLKTAFSRESFNELTNTTHTVNNRIRYYFAGTEQNLEKFKKKAYKVFGGILEKGGDRTVEFDYGAKGQIGLGTMFGADASASVSARGVHKAKVNINPTTKEVTVTYTNGAELAAAVKAKFGTDENGGSVGANASGGLVKNFSLTYRNFDDFVAAQNGAADVVDATVYNRTACLGKIVTFFKMIGHGFTKAATALGLRIAKSKSDNNEYRDSLRKLNVFSNLDSMVAHKENVITTMKGTSWNAYGKLGVKGELTNEAKFFEGNASLSGSYSREFSVENNTYRTALETMNLQSDDFIRREVGNWLEGYPREERVREGMADLSSGLVRIEQDAAALQRRGNATKAEWVDLTARLKDLIAKTIYLQRDLGGITNDDQQSFLANFAEKLISPDFKIPEDAYEEGMMSKVGTSHNGRNTVSVDLKLSYDFFGGKSKDIASNVVGSDIVGNVIGNAVHEGVSALVPISNDVSVNYTYTSPVNKNDVRPWKNGATHTLTIGMAPGLTSRALCELIARAAFDKFSDDTGKKSAKEIANEVLNDFWGALQESAGKDLAHDLMDVPLRELAKHNDKLANFIGKSVIGTEDDAGLDFGSETAYAKSVSFTWCGGKLCSMGSSEFTSVSGSLGFSVPILPGISIGLEMKDTLSILEMDRFVMVRPGLAGLMGAAEGYLGRGDHQGLELFLTHNKPGVLEFLANTQANMPDDVESVLHRLEEKARAVGGDPRGAPNVDAFLDRLNNAREQIAHARDAVNSADLDSLDDEAKIHLAQRFIEAMTIGYTSLVEN